MNRTQAWKEYMESRKISPSAYHRAGISFTDSKLVIPVRDHNGKHLFNKYRRAPWVEGGPKYTYDAGAKSALFGLHSLDLAHDYVYITEGEIDALTMHTIGHPAVSGTGGAGTWQVEWNKHLEGREVLVLFDADAAGARGAIKVAMKIGRPVKLCLLNDSFGKDINEQYVKLNGLAYEVVDMPYESESDIPFIIDLLKPLRRRSFSVDGTTLWKQIDVIIDELTDQIPKPKPKRKEMHNASDKERALEYPIENIIRTRKDGKALCPFHDEKTPSFKVYKDNHGYCFGECQRSYDAIAVYMQVNKDRLPHDEKEAFKQAIREMQ